MQTTIYSAQDEQTLMARLWAPQIKDNPLAQMAVTKGKADGEMEMSQVLHAAAREGDAKAALEILKHQHDWVAKQQVQVDVNQQISILGALREAEQRVIDVQAIEHADNHLLGAGRTVTDGAAVVRADQR